MLTDVQDEVDSRKLGGSALLLPLKDIWLAPVTPDEVRQYIHGHGDGQVARRHGVADLHLWHGSSRP